MSAPIFWIQGRHDYVREIVKIAGEQERSHAPCRDKVKSFSKYPKFGSATLSREFRWDGREIGESAAFACWLANKENLISNGSCAARAIPSFFTGKAGTI
jgi:hypothetical protein